MIKKLFKGFAFKLLDFIRPLIIIPFFIRHYGIESFGIYNQIIYLSTLLYPIIDLGIGMAFQRFANELKSYSERLNIFTVQKFFILAIAVIYLLLINIDSVNNLLFGAHQSFLFAFFTFFYIIFFALNNTLQGVMRADSKIDRLIRYRVIFAAFEAVVLILVLYVYKKFDHVYISLMVLSQIFYFYLLNRETKGLVTNFKAKFELTEQSKTFFRYSVLLIPTALIAWVTSSSDRFFITNYFGAESTGYYSVVAQYTGYMKLIVFPFTFVYFKDFGQLYDSSYKNFLKLYGKTFLFCICLSVVFSFFFYLLINPIYESYIGIDLTPEIVNLTVWFLVTFILVNATSFMSTYLLVSKRTKVILVAVILGAVLNFILNKFLLKHYTYTHAIYYYVVSVALQILVMGIFIIKDIFKHEKSPVR